MKKLTALALPVFVVIFIAGALSAAEAQWNRHQTVSNVTCDPILSAQSFVISGIVSAVSAPDSREGITVTTGSGEAVALYGLGPARYWEDLDIDRPVVGDVVLIDAKAVTIGEDVKNIILSLAYEDGSTIQLRDVATGCPLWRVMGKRARAGSAN